MLNADCVIIDCLHSALYLESKQSRPVSGVCSTSGEIWDVTVNSPVYLSDSLYLSLAVKYQQTRREMARWTGWLIVLYQARLLQADLAGPVGDSLDRLLLADLEFWAGREVADISSPADLSSLYHHRFANTLWCSATSPLPELLSRASKIFQTQLMIKFPRDFSEVTKERWSGCSYMVKRLQVFLKTKQFWI